ncbi:hypothetical protein BDV98DRAFT_596577 [Pterulicium gracile]|uniref:Uncharacterized protein n=1 Tax=Pterulicium gracile TaxID=1884261 RepID=A0A5C3Q7Q2_9AGAR|nr:hypothetical protein BDV98DRAFT_596577 [Pterula gracilis]
MSDSSDWDSFDNEPSVLSSITPELPARDDGRKELEQDDNDRHGIEVSSETRMLSMDSLPMPFMGALNDKDSQTLKQEIPGYMLEPTRSYVHWIVN